MPPPTYINTTTTSLRQDGIGNNRFRRIEIVDHHFIRKSWVNDPTPTLSRSRKLVPPVDLTTPRYVQVGLILALSPSLWLLIAASLVNGMAAVECCRDFVLSIVNLMSNRLFIDAFHFRPSNSSRETAAQRVGKFSSELRSPSFMVSPDWVPETRREPNKNCSSVRNATHSSRSCKMRPIANTLWEKRNCKNKRQPSCRRFRDGRLESLNITIRQGGHPITLWIPWRATWRNKQIRDLKILDSARVESCIVIPNGKLYNPFEIYLDYICIILGPIRGELGCYKGKLK